ncbi:hypothetical protein COLO4_26960 [Corchorus olitorius]|uniref:Uncharacterized protein n=1 Tax=Corchorus olitorius TaxID=93759 RepID=A0A1R3HTF2_9ROSI|nr:hypothetical protein COLO4_26960 [Corchorus olitorius]
MDIKNRCNSGCKTVCLGQGYHEVGAAVVDSPSSSAAIGSGSNKLNWKVIWMKIKKEKRKMLESPAQQVPYDSYTYSQNFDQGFAWDEPDNLS